MVNIEFDVGPYVMTIINLELIDAIQLFYSTYIHALSIS